MNVDTIKKCRWCGTEPCPYPTDEEFRQQVEKHGKQWLRDMPCWTPIEEFSVVSWTCPYCGRKMYSAWERPDEETTECIYCGKVFENPYYRKGGGKTVAGSSDL